MGSVVMELMGSVVMDGQWSDGTVQKCAVGICAMYCQLVLPLVPFSFQKLKGVTESLHLLTKAKKQQFEYIFTNLDPNVCGCGHHEAWL